MKTLFLVGLLVLGTYSATAVEKPQEFWVNVEGDKINFHLIADISNMTDAAWTGDVMSAVRDVTYETAKGQVKPPPLLRPDLDKGEMLVQFTMTSPKTNSAKLIKIIKDRLGKGYKQIKGPKML